MRTARSPLDLRAAAPSGPTGQSELHPQAQLRLPGSGTPTTSLGYGCSQLMGRLTRRESLALLEAAFDSGIRHFDTAPSYALGQSERVLGEAFRARRDRITITTKYGLRLPRGQSFLGIARRVLLPVIRHVPAVKARLARAAGGLAGKARFSADELRTSIDASLAALQTDYIDVLLLHEAVAGDLTDELFTALERSVEAGKIRSFGIGSEAAAIAPIYRDAPRFCPILQFEWSVLSRDKPAYPDSFLITHRSLSGNVARLRAWLDAHPQMAAAWSTELDRDVASAPVLSRLMLAAARHVNPAGITLFSSRNAENIRANARAMEGAGDALAAAAFAALVARDTAAAPGQSSAR
jgi:D-threo-aldose 1-dehydrogenase